MTETEKDQYIKENAEEIVNAVESGDADKLAELLTPTIDLPEIVFPKQVTMQWEDEDGTIHYEFITEYRSGWRKL